MALFNIPGWSVSASPVAESSHQVSKKRKRPTSDPEKLPSAEVNLEKLVRRLKGSSGKHEGETSQKLGRKERKNKSNKVAVGVEKNLISHPKLLKPNDKSSITSEPPAKRSKTQVTKAESSSTVNLSLAKRVDDGSTDTDGLTALQKGMKQSLDGARFRIINESLYKTNSLEAHQMIRDDPRVFEDYHIGFRHQVQTWPTNPVEHYISVLTKCPEKTVIADLGCGDAALARSLILKGITVLSYDLISDNKFVVEADTCSKIPLPGSEPPKDEKSNGEGHVVDIVVCALSLMGTNWPNCLREAWRILKPDGELKIAEVTSRLTDVEGFQTLVGLVGFKLKSKDSSNSHFTLFEFKKVPRKGKSDKEWAGLLSKASILKPCEYKRR